MEGWDNVEASEAAEVPGFVGDGFVVDDEAVDNGDKMGGLIVEWYIGVSPG